MRNFIGPQLLEFLAVRQERRDDCIDRRLGVTLNASRLTLHWHVKTRVNCIIPIVAVYDLISHLVRKRGSFLVRLDQRLLFQSSL